MRLPWPALPGLHRTALLPLHNTRTYGIGYSPTGPGGRARDDDALSLPCPSACAFLRPSFSTRGQPCEPEYGASR